VWLSVMVIAASFSAGARISRVAPASGSPT
jgi:hypothetical protein